MTDKKNTTYNILFSLIKSQIGGWDPSSFTCDFEEAIMSAIKEIFPKVNPRFTVAITI